jgi:hypothetical protein
MTRIDEIKARAAKTDALRAKANLVAAGQNVLVNEDLEWADAVIELADHLSRSSADIPWLLAEVERLKGCLADYDDMQGRLDDTNSFASDIIGLILDHCGEDGGHPDDQYTVSDMDSLLKKKGEENAKLRATLSSALEWIDAVPGDVQLPAMPGFDRDDANELLEVL